MCDFCWGHGTIQPCAPTNTSANTLTVRKVTSTWPVTVSPSEEMDDA